MTAAQENYPALSGYYQLCQKCAIESCATYTYQLGTASHPQHMQRMCLNCGYTWQEKCADA